MTTIDAVIARSRMPGGFSERKRFTVARREGIEKLREFALADPHHYVLELIQAAIANGAESIDLSVDKTSATLSYIGGGLKEHELAQLFDFLFASKDRAEIGHVRELALGLNAALLFKPERIVVESGDGTLEGSTRMVLHGDQDTVEVGRPEQAMAGTYVLIAGMRRNALHGRWFSNFNEDWPTEYAVIEERCLAAPIPIVVGGCPLFGWSSQRTPGLGGYQRVLSFDEGDLYGTLGHKPSFGNPEFRLLTWGVAIQSRTHALIPGQPIGGIVCFDRLHKTVDHSAIVDDERLAEMFARLQPYARQLVSGQTQPSTHTAKLLGSDEVLAPVQLRGLVRGTPRVVVVPQQTRQDTAEGQRAHAIGDALAAPVLCMQPEQMRILPLLGGSALGVVRPDLRTDHDVAFFCGPAALPPAKPWLTRPVDAAPLPTPDLAKRLDSDLSTSELAQWLGIGEVTARVFTPLDTRQRGQGLQVRLITTERVAWAGEVPSTYAGYALDVELPHTPPALLRRAVDGSPDAPPLAEAIAHAMAQHAADAIKGAYDRAVADLEHKAECKPGTAEATLGLSAAARSTMARLRVRDDRAGIELVPLGLQGSSMLGLPLLRYCDGTATTLREATETAAHGLLYGRHVSVPADLEGLDASKVLDLNAVDERLLIDLVGSAAYVRVDARDVLAEYEGVVVRDIAIGLREFPDFPLLIEGRDPSTWSVEDRRACLDALLGQLIDRLTGTTPPRPPDPQRVAEWEECRRQACRHLQWAALRLDDAAPMRLAALPLFCDTEDRVWTWGAVRAAVREGRVSALYGAELGERQLGLLSEAALSPDAPIELGHARATLVLAPFMHQLMAPLGVPLPATPRRHNPDGPTSLLGGVALQDAELNGHIGVDAEGGVAQVVVVLGDGRRLLQPALARHYGTTGVVSVSAVWSPATEQRVLGALDAASQASLRKLLAQLRSAASMTTAIGSVLLAYAARCLRLTAKPDGVVEATPGSALAAEILALPLFPSRFGGPMPGWRLVRRFASAATLVPDPTQAVLDELDPAAPEWLVAWIRTHLRVSRISRRPATVTRTALAPPPTTAATLQHVALATRLGAWLQRLRPDTAEPVDVIIQYRGEDGPWATGGVEEVIVNGDHWLASWCLAAPGDNAEPLAWALLAIYAFINEVREHITNAHERTFQINVAQALASGALVSDHESSAAPRDLDR